MTGMPKGALAQFAGALLASTFFVSPASAGSFAQAVNAASGATPQTVAPPSVPTPAESPQADTVTPQSASADGDIIVTANKRSESLQRVPVSVVAVPPRVLTETGVVSTTQLQQVVPGISFTPSAEAKLQSFYVRGVGTYGLSSTLESSVGVTVDGVPLARVGGSVSDIVDVERVEVLKGPQGLLFGKNATAGLIGIVTRKPDFGVTGGDAHLSYGSYNELNIDAALNLAIGDAAAFRITGWRYGHDGFVDDILSDRKFNSKNSYGARIGFAVEPVNDVRVTLIGQFDGRNDTGGVSTFREFKNLPPFGSLIEAYEASIGITPRAGYLKADVGNRQYGFGSNFYATGLVDWDVGGGFTLSSVTSYRDVLSKGQFDPFATSFPKLFLRAITDDEHYDQFTQELRVTSPTDRRLSFVAGLFYYDFHIKDVQIQNFVGIPVPGSSDFTRRNTVRNALRDFAAFAELTFRLTPKLRLIAGGRQSHDYTTGFFSRERVGTDLGVIPPTVPVFSFTPRSRKYDATSYRFGVQFDAAPDVLLYATTSRGYKAPGFNLTQSLTPTVAAATDARVDAEIAKSYEVGVKSQFFDRRITVNVTGFHSIFSNFQATVQLPITPPTFAIQNAGELRSDGVEFDVSVRPVTGFSFGINGAYIHARYTDFNNAACYPGEPTLPTGSALQPGFCVGGVQTLNGYSLAQSPKWSYNISGRYEHGVGSDLKAFISGNYSYRGFTVYESARDPNEVQNGYGFANFTVGVGPQDDRWSVAVYARNLFDANFVTRVRQSNGSILQGPSYEATRRFGVQLAGKF